MSSLPNLNYQQIIATRDYIQDIAKVVGKAQQPFLPVDPNSWQKGLWVTESGISSQTMNGQQFVLDLKKGQLRGFGQTWPLGSIEPTQLQHEIQQITDQPIETPEYTAKSLTYDQAVADDIREAFNFAAQELGELGRELKNGVVCPIFIYPHHFDVSLVWYPRRQVPRDTDERQFTFGFSTGDTDIQEPYFYITAYPEPANFNTIPLKEPAYWQTDGFSGAVIKYNDIAAKGDPAKYLEKFFESIVSVQKEIGIL